MNKVAIELQNLSYSYRSDFLVRRIDALRNISLSVQAGEAFGYLGPNGAGKTTTIKCLLGLIKPRRGQATIFGAPAGSLTARAHLGYLAEQPYFYDYLTVDETMHLFASLAGLGGSTKKQRVQEALERVGMTSRVHSKMRALSKGLTQRVALAQALVATPKLVILDEPFSGLDPIGRKEFRQIFLDLKKEGVTLFMSSHVLSDVEYLCDRASIAVRGELKTIVDLKQRQQNNDHFEITTAVPIPPEVLSHLNPQAARTVQGQGEITVQGLENAQGVVRVLTERHIPIIRFEQVQPSLEQLFMSVVGAPEGV